MRGRFLAVILLVTTICVLAPRRASAGAFEFSFGFSFNHSNYSDGNFSWNRRWMSGLGYYFTERSQIEFAIQDIVDRNRIVKYEDTTFHDQVFSVNWVQEIIGKSFPVQPYFKVGIGQLNRDASGKYSDGYVPPLHVDAVTGIIGAGVRVNLTRTFGIRTDATSYLSKGSIRSWKDNVSFTLGLSIYF